MHTKKRRNFSANTTMQKGRLSDSSAADNEVVIFSHVLVYHSWVVCHLSEGIPLELLKSVLNALLPSIVVCLSSSTHLHHKNMHVGRAAVKDWNSRLSANITNHVLYTFFSSALKLLSSQKTHHSSSSLSHVYGSIHASKAQLDNIQNSFSLYTQLSIQL